MIIVIPTNMELTAHGTAHIYWDHVWSKHGLLVLPQLSSAFFRLFCAFFVTENVVINVTVQEMVTDIAPLYTFQLKNNYPNTCSQPWNIQRITCGFFEWLQSRATAKLTYVINQWPNPFSPISNFQDFGVIYVIKYSGGFKYFISHDIKIGLKTQQHYGLPRKVISNWGPQFAAQFMKDLHRLTGVVRNLSTAYHPQTDGQMEWINQEVEQYLQLFVNHRQSDWYEWQSCTEFSYNDKVQMYMGSSPFFINYGWHPY